MDPPSPLKFPMSPGMPIFPVSPERVAGTKPPYGGPAPGSPSNQELRTPTSPLRQQHHRRNDSDVSVHGLATMFENLDVKDFKEAQAKYLVALQKQKTKHAIEIKELERKHAVWMSRRELRVEELKDALERAQDTSKEVVPKDSWDAARQDHREAIAKWEKALQQSEEKRKQTEKKAHEHSNENNILKSKLAQYKKRNIELSKEAMRATSYIPTFQAKIQGLERTARMNESDLKHQTSEAEKYKNQVYGLQVELESVEARLAEEVKTLKDRLILTEGERDALKTSLKEEEVMRIAAEGQIALPTVTSEEQDEFASPIRSPRKQRTTPERDDDDKENVSPKKASVELRFLQQELASEKALRERAQEQIEFMKMECQFECCSCRIADLKGAKFVHDASYIMEMERIKTSVPVTPPHSDHGDDIMVDVIIKQEPVDDARPITPPQEGPLEEKTESLEDAMMMTGFSRAPSSDATEPEVAFSPTTGTFRAMPSPAKAAASAHTATPTQTSRLDLCAINETAPGSSPWNPDAESTVIRTEPASPTAFRVEPKEARETSSVSEAKTNGIFIHEDVIDDSDEEGLDDEIDGVRTPVHAPSGPATPGPYLMRTITTTTTIPLHFSPFTPATKRTDGPMTPSTIAHAPANAQTPVLGELSLNQLPFDREVALAAIRERRGRARSMAAGHGTPRKQMMEGVSERRDISAPVSRVRR